MMDISTTSAHFTSCLEVWWSGADELMYGKVGYRWGEGGRGQYLTPGKKGHIRTHGFEATRSSYLEIHPPT